MFTCFGFTTVQTKNNLILVTCQKTKNKNIFKLVQEFKDAVQQPHFSGDLFLISPLCSFLGVIHDNTC